MAGKVSSIIASSYGGAVIARSYNPKKKQVNSVGQVEAKAKLKLIGQIAAELAPFIVIPPVGNITSRNLFIKKNYHFIYVNEDSAQVTYENLQLTGGMAGLPAIYAKRNPITGIVVRLAEKMHDGVSRVIYILCRKTDNGKILRVASAIANNKGTDSLYPASLPYTEGDIILFAYGMKDIAESARVKYGNMKVTSAMDIKALYLRHIKGKKDTIFTMTRGTTLYADQNESDFIPEGYARVFVTPFGNGSVDGSGIYQIGTEVTVYAFPDSDYDFAGWKINGSDIIISTEPFYTFELLGQIDLVGVFEKSISQYYVDMGLPSGTLWAKCNLDVLQPNKFTESEFQYDCSFFSWGNTDGHNPISPTKFDYDFGNVNSQAPWYEGQPYGNTPGSQLQTDIPISTSYDAARAALGEPWRMPTVENIRELLDNIIFINADGTEVDSTKLDKRVTVNGILGIYLQSKINGNRLFFACSGYGAKNNRSERGSRGNYWFSSIDDMRSAQMMRFDQLVSIMITGNRRYLGFAVRPVI